MAKLVSGPRRLPFDQSFIDGLKRGRGAEEQVLSLLQAWNWQVEDVSREAAASA